MQSSRKQQVLPNQELQFLNLKSGETLVPSWETVTQLHGGYSTPNTGESPTVDVVSSLFSILEENVQRKYYLSPRAASGILRRAENRKKGTSSNTEGGTHGCSKTFTIGGYADYDEVTIGSSLRASGGDIGGGSETLVVEELPAIYDMTHAQDVIREYGQIVPTLQARMGTGGNNVPLVLTESPCYVMATGHTNAEITTDIAPTLLGEAHEQPILFRKEGVEYVVRRLTPRETERLMGLPDDWTLVQFNNKMMADTTRYKMVGNGVAVPCALRVLSGIVEQQGKE